jgi:type III secretory pathway component EscU
MILLFSLRNIIKRMKLCFKVLILAVLIFYILPKLLTLFWHIGDQEQKIQDQHIFEKPLRVTADTLDRT